MATTSAYDDEELGGVYDEWSKNENGTTYVGGKQNTGGSSGSTGGNSNNGSPIHQVDYVPPRQPTPEECKINWDSMIRCWEHVERGEDDPEDSTPAIPEVTITDLASFSPDPGTLTGEPDNLGVAGLPTNFTTDTAEHTRDGELFGFPIRVRFTPITHTFHYGDGQSQASDTPGASWDALDQAQFTPTDTSHTYAERGTYHARVDTAYSAEIDLGVGWFPLTGQLDIPGAPQTIRIYEAHTALVAHTCTENPTAPGC
ncbi:hypothetical protein [Microbacterium esteraromaticum]|uniref:hypothetical protein n=1 Tax=Microbacterium esteraromaticum TaxID=57043 RepID=UPI001C94D161|nr:hypothetical protein [Microbacterium esteraromaticum]MBY6060541.1 hypothetical protein [Microbacterium esteraromaticum]